MIWSWFKLIFLIFIMVGCCRQQDLELREEINDWNPHVFQEEITFSNQAGNNLTFTALTQKYNQSGQDKVCGNYDIETLKTTLTPTSDPNFKIEIILSHEVLVSIKAFSLAPAGRNIDIQFNSVAYQYISDDWRDQYLKSVELNNKSYQHVLHVFGNQASHDLAFSEMYYAKEKGLVAFKTFAGEWYYLV